eukprot:gene15311-18140_t
MPEFFSLLHSNSSVSALDSLSQIQSLASLQSSPPIGAFTSSSASTAGNGSATDKKIQMSLQQLRELNSGSRATSRTSTPSSSQEVADVNHHATSTTTTTTTSSAPPPAATTTNKRKKRATPVAPAPAPATAKRGGRGRKAAAPPPTEDDEDDDEDEEEAGPKKIKSDKTRFDNSLVQLTKKFVDLVEKAPNGILDLKVAAETIDITKRRIYDVTCVLEGIGMIQKCSKNQIQWRGEDHSSKGAPNSAAADKNAIDNETRKLLEKEANIDNCTKNIQKNIQHVIQEAATARLFFAPQGTQLEVADPDEGMIPPARRYMIHLNSETRQPIDTTYWEPQTPAIAAYSPFEFQQHAHLHQSPGKLHHALQSNQQYPTFTEQMYGDQSTTTVNNTTESEYYFDSMIDSEAQSFDEFQNQST